MVRGTIISMETRPGRLKSSCQVLTEDGNIFDCTLVSRTPEKNVYRVGMPVTGTLMGRPGRETMRRVRPMGERVKP